MGNLERFAEVVFDLKEHHLIGQIASHFKISSLRILFPDMDDLFDWIPIFFGGTNNKNWLENVSKVTMVGCGKKRELLISKKKGNYEKKIPECISKIKIPNYIKKKQIIY